MSKKILVYDEVYRMLEEAKEQRLEDGWKRGASLEQIASEAIIFWCSQLKATDLSGVLMAVLKS